VGELPFEIVAETELDVPEPLLEYEPKLPGCEEMVALVFLVTVADPSVPQHPALDLDLK
tara:strand:- start:399 stop:575 length:177 start_codon:yes stop_codon:yes gene_type:complete